MLCNDVEKWHIFLGAFFLNVTMLAIAMLVELVVSVLKIFTEYQWSMIAGLNLYEIRVSRLFKRLWSSQN